jgi:type I restriction-modification system DNA methylase subunit
MTIKMDLFNEKKTRFKQTIDVDHNFQTPLKVCRYMVDMVPENAKSILEPTPGLGNIVHALSEKNKYDITAADDFFLLDKNIRYDCIVMNPPFSAKSADLRNANLDDEVKGMKLGYYILIECMKMSDNVIALMPWYTISDSDVRSKFLEDFGIKSITSLPRKTFQYARIQTVILELSKGYCGDIVFRNLRF